MKMKVQCTSIDRDSYRLCRLIVFETILKIGYTLFWDKVTTSKSVLNFSLKSEIALVSCVALSLDIQSLTWTKIKVIG